MKQKIDALLRRCLESGSYVGANAAVYKDGNCIYTGSCGFADREAGTPMTTDTIFKVYSLTKPVTAVAVMQLVEEGLIHPDEPVSWFLPEFEKLNVYDEDGTVRPAKTPLRIRHLLTMRSGLPYPGDRKKSQQETGSFFWEMSQKIGTKDAADTQEFCRRMAQIPLEFEPGTHWDYGVSADILGALVEAVTKQDYRSYLLENIFGPLGMTDTDFYVHPEKLGRFAASYKPGKNGLERDENCYLGLNDQRSLPAFISGGAGLTSTIVDYAKFACCLANGGTAADRTRILSPASVRYISTPQVFGETFLKDQDWDSLRGYAYGSLVRVLTDPTMAGTLANPGEFGWDGMTGAYFCADPKENLCILFWQQTAFAGFSEPAKLMRNIVYGAL